MSAGLELITLENGVRLALDPMPGLHTAAVGAWVRVGARWESAHQNGVAHLFEHMAFKGAGGRDAQAFAEAIEAVGGAMNAATGYERTAYYAR
ncbi:MAG: insulinase family protein, partial [Alphaproteobacteria bacterium]|nr:insulinase family protein [Alphaproteobacteria bacterium]